MESQDAPKRNLLALAALGIVYGDIGTSPLYALRECFSPAIGLTPTPPTILGILSLLIWALLLVVTVKYLWVVMRADNNGEGGILALMALAHRDQGAPARRRPPRRGVRGVAEGQSVGGFAVQGGPGRARLAEAAGTQAQAVARINAMMGVDGPDRAVSGVARGGH